MSEFSPRPLDKIPDVETYDLAATVSGPVPPDMALWPAKMQDKVFRALEAVNDRRKIEGKPALGIASCRCERDPDNGEWYVHISAQPLAFLGGKGLIQ